MRHSVSLRMDRGESLGWVYVIEAGENGNIKIGWAKNPALRMKQLQTGSHAELDLVGVIPGTRFLEADIHRRLAECRLVGEWFLRDEALPRVEPLIRDFGFFITSEYLDSRNSPGPKYNSRLPKRNFFFIIPKVRAI